MTTMQTDRRMRSKEYTMAARTVGGDFGNSTALLVDDGKVLQIPSFVGFGSLRDLLESRSGVGGTGRLLPSEYAVEHQGRVFFVGELALSQLGAAATTGRSDTARYHNGHTLRLLMALAGAMYDSTTVQLRLVTGVPPSVLKEQPNIRDLIARSLAGSHRYTFHDEHGAREMTLTVERVAVVMESLAPLSVLGELGKPVGLVDIGGFTVDISWLDRQGRVVDTKVASKPNAGTERIGELISQQFRRQYGRLLLQTELNYILGAYTIGCEATVFHNGEQVTISNIEVSRLVRQVAETINEFLAQHWSLGSAGTVAADAAYVLVIGGGARFFGNGLLRLDTDVRIPDCPEQATARSYAQFAARIEQRGTWPVPAEDE